ncbi:tyrosinase cofactor [Streptomyces sp. NPDC051162]|uniref:apotyrosinase chaperone MelC1 n=1 Tax=Streptomyces sp. NPDC051162 TaxID=3154747 RepID=UPI003419C77D
MAGAALAAPAATAATRSTMASTMDHSGHSENTEHNGHTGPQPFDEIYQGRHIVGKAAEPGSMSAHHGGDFSVFIDDRELHIMRLGDGTWISVVNHYLPLDDPRDLARTAVEKLRGATLVPMMTA